MKIRKKKAKREDVDETSGFLMPNEHGNRDWSVAMSFIYAMWDSGTTKCVVSAFGLWQLHIQLPIL